MGSKQVSFVERSSLSQRVPYNIVVLKAHCDLTMTNEKSFDEMSCPCSS